GGTAHWTFDGNASMPAASGDVAITITSAAAQVTVTGFAGTYDGQPHGASGTAKGLNNADLSLLLHLGATFTNAPGGTAHWTFDGDANYAAQSGDAAITINPIAATVNVSGFTGAYDGSPHGASGTAKGLSNADLSSLLHLGATFTNAPGGT